MDASGNALCPAIVWLDNRANQESFELADRFPAAELYARTGQPAMLATWPAAKLLWLARHQPHRATHGALSADRGLPARPDDRRVRHRGVVGHVDVLLGSCHQDLVAGDADALAVRADQLPTVVEPGTPVGRILPAVADELGLDSTTVVCAGALDQACGAIGGGNVAPGGFSENTGAAVAICSTLQELSWDPAGWSPCTITESRTPTCSTHSVAAGLC